MNVPASVALKRDDRAKCEVIVIAPAAGGGAEMTYHQNDPHHTLVKAEPGDNDNKPSPTSPLFQARSTTAAEEDGDADIIEVFRFDRNSLKLRCEEISPKQLKAVSISNQNGLPKSTPTSSSVVKRIQATSGSSDSDSDNDNSSSSSSSSSSSGSSSSSSSSTSSSTSSSSNSSSSTCSKTTTAKPKTTGTFSSTSASNKKDSSSCTSSSSGSSSSSSSSSSCSSETENASDFEDELSKKRQKIRKKTMKKRPFSLPENSSICSSVEKEVKVSSSSSGDLKYSSCSTKAFTTTVKMEGMDKKEENETEMSSSPVDLLKLEREDFDDEEEKDEECDLRTEMVRIDDFVGGKSKQRKNSKWGDYVGARKSSRLAPRALFSNKNYEVQVKKRLRTLVKKNPSEWTNDDRTCMQSFPKLLSEVEKRLQKRKVASERLKESEDPPELLEKKCAQLASVISRARYLIIYTGAGISTSAKIPDYRGPNGIWTLLQKGEQVTQSLTDISQTADPTLTHMAIKALYDHQICKHIVSQNVDGLHLRSGIPKVALSEVHGNIFVEACTHCGREFVRLFDVTENTRRHHHKTARFCYHCGTSLRDTVVLFGEKGSLKWPLNWSGAEYNVDKADVILCLGSSLKVLRRYPWLWSMAKPPQKRPKLYIVNLQWTPKDQFALLKINGKCDQVMEKVMSYLNVPIPQYSRQTDAIFTVATHLHSMEGHTKGSSELWYPSDIPYPEKNKDMRNYIRFEPVFKVPVPYEQKVDNMKVEIKRENYDTSGEGSDAVEVAVVEDNNELDRQEQVKQRKRVLKGNNFSWLGNTVISKLQKKRKLK